MWGNCISNGIVTLGCIPALYTAAISLALTFVSTAAVVLLILAGIKYITSGGGKQIEEAKNMVTYAIIGFIIVLLSFFIIDLVARTTGVLCILSFGIQSCQ